MLSSVQPSANRPLLVIGAPAGACGAGPEARLLALIVRNQLVQGESAKVSVNLSQEQLAQLREDVRQALQAARDAHEDSGFWGDIGDVLGGDIATLAEVVVVAAAAVATGGAAALVLGAITVACTLASKYADELGIPQEVAIGIAMAAAVTSVVSGNIAASGDLAALTAVPNGAASVGGGAAQVSRLTQIARDVKFWASLTAPAASGAGAGLHMLEAYYASEALDHRADARAAQAQERLQSLDIDSAVELLSRALDRQLAALAETCQTLEANQQTKQLVINGFQGAA